MAQEGVGFTRLTASGIVNEGQTLLYGVLLLTSVTGGDITLYEGTDAVAGRPFAKICADASITKSVNFSFPVYFDRGLYVSFGSNVTEVLISWLPLGVG